MVICHLILLILLGVDWLDDPHFGCSVFSRPMASQPYNALQETDRQESVSDVPMALDQFLVVHSLPLCQNTAGFTPLQIPSFCISSLHLFMSLQR